MALEGIVVSAQEIDAIPDVKVSVLCWIILFIFFSIGNAQSEYMTICLNMVGET